MNEIIADLEKGLSSQLSSLADTIRGSEEQLMRNKEAYLKVQGALEVLAVIKDRSAQQEAEAVQLAVGTPGVD